MRIWLGVDIYLDFWILGEFYYFYLFVVLNKSVVFCEIYFCFSDFEFFVVIGNFCFVLFFNDLV